MKNGTFYITLCLLVAFAFMSCSRNNYSSKSKVEEKATEDSTFSLRSDSNSTFNSQRDTVYDCTFQYNIHYDYDDKGNISNINITGKENKKGSVRENTKSSNSAEITGNSSHQNTSTAVESKKETKKTSFNGPACCWLGLLIASLILFVVYKIRKYLHGKN